MILRKLLISINVKYCTEVAILSQKRTTPGTMQTNVCRKLKYTINAINIKKKTSLILYHLPAKLSHIRDINRVPLPPYQLDLPRLKASVREHLIR